MALGLVSSSTLHDGAVDFWSRNTRRRVAYDFPQGTAPLTALLSLMEPESTPISVFGWQESRFTQIKTTLTITTGLPTDNVNFYLAGTTTTAGTPVTPAVGTSYRAYVDDASNFQVDDSVVFWNLVLTSGYGNLTGRITATNTTGADYVEFEATNALPSTIINNVAGDGSVASAGNEGKSVFLMGSAFAEGSRSRTGRNKYPIEINNCAQIHKNAFELTRNALKTPTTYNKSGHYEKALKDNGIDHLSGLEKTTLFGKRRYANAVDPDTGETVKRYFSGGLLWFLEQWELGNTSNTVGGVTGEINYRPGGAAVTTQTDWETYTDKRIIKLAGGTLSKSQFNELTSRAFEKTNNSSFDKLVLCGQGYYNKVSESFEKQITKYELRENGFKGYDFHLQEHASNSGTMYYKTHPLFTDSVFRNSAFIIDLGFLKYRYITDSDTDIVQGIQLPDADKRKDQYLTDAGIEIWYPEAHMFIQDLGGITS
jgi:hypothetical protein